MLLEEVLGLQLLLGLLAERGLHGGRVRATRELESGGKSLEAASQVLLLELLHGLHLLHLLQIAIHLGLLLELGHGLELLGAGIGKSWILLHTKSKTQRILLVQRRWLGSQAGVPSWADTARLRASHLPSMHCVWIIGILAILILSMLLIAHISLYLNYK